MFKLFFEKFFIKKPKYQIRDGHRKSFHPNGKIKTSVVIKDGKKEGFYKKWDIDGNLIRKIPFKNSLIHGQALHLYSNGQILIDRFFKNGIQEGEDRRYYENGKLKSSIFSKMD